MIQVKFTVAIGAGEVSSGATHDMFQLKDSATGRFIGLWYDLFNTQWQLFEGVGGSGVVNIPQTLVADQLEGFTINVLPQSGGTQVVHVYHAGVYLGTFTTVLAMNFDTLLLGAVAITHGSGGGVDRTFSGVRLGTSAGASDLFDDNSYSTGTVVPPWTAQSGGAISLSGSQLNIANGGADAFVFKRFVLPPVKPPKPPIPTVGPSGLIFVGNVDWQQAGAARWLVNGWEMDRLVIPWRGSIEGLSDFLDAYKVWMPSDVDKDMFLENYPQDEHKQFPTVNLTFVGKRGGILPPDRHESSSSIQQVSGIVFSDSYILTFGLPPHWTARITYISPITRFVTWSRTEPNFDSITAPAPPDLTSENIVSLVLGGVDYTVWPAAAANYGKIVAWVLRWFMQRTARYTSSQELAPDQYFRGEVTTQKLLLPIQEEIVT